MNKQLPIANDNAPADQAQNAGLGMPQPLRHRQITERPSVIVSQTPSHGNYSPVWTPKLQRAKPGMPKPASAATYLLTAMIWVGAVLANIAAIIFAPVNTVHLVVVIAAIWSSLMMIYVAQSRGQTVLAEMASLATIAAFGLSLYVTSMRFGIASGPATGAALGAFAAAGLGLVTGSKLALRISAFAALAWAAITLTGSDVNVAALTQGNFKQIGLPKPGAAWIAFPALLALQGFAMARHRDGPALGVAVFAAYIIALGGLSGLVFTGQVSPILAASGLLLVGLMHSRIGKLMGRKGIFGGALHAGSGAAAMLAGLIALQDYWTLPARPIWTDAIPSGAQWAGGLAIGSALLCAIFILDLKRERLSVSAISKAGFLTLPAGSAAYLSARPSIIEAPLMDYGLKAAPYAGLVIAGVILALGLALIANGFRRHIAGFVAIGALAIAGSVFLILPVIMTAPETGIIYAASAFVAGLVSAAFISLPNETGPLPYKSAADRRAPRVYAND